MKIKAGGKYGWTALRCDALGCTATFVTYSLSRVTRTQAALVGWVRYKRQKLDLCPTCRTSSEQRRAGNRRLALPSPTPLR